MIVKEIKAGTTRGPVNVTQNFAVLASDGTVLKPVPPPMPIGVPGTEPLRNPTPRAAKRKRKEGKRG